MAFTDEQIQQVWEKGREVEGYDKDKYRKDACGAWMIRGKYGDGSSIYGWVIDHIMPRILLFELGISESEINSLENLRPFNYINNMEKGRDFPRYHASVVSKGEKNIREMGVFRVSERKVVSLLKKFKLL